MCQICKNSFHFAAAIVVHINCAFEFSIFYLPVHDLHILWLFQLFFFSSFERVFLSIFISSLSFTYYSLSYFFSLYLHLSFSFHSSVYFSIICHLSFEFTLSSLTRATAANQVSCVNFSKWFLIFDFCRKSQNKTFLMIFDFCRKSQNKTFLMIFDFCWKSETHKTKLF